jgi:PhzF family phenazine biosynthesis protein
MTVKTYIVDAFTSEPFKGNQAGVCLLEAPLLEEMMLRIAQEFGFSETAFVVPDGAAGRYRIRYFSPKKEIPLCGHATLGSSKVIFSVAPLEEVRFTTVENIELVVARSGDSMTMEFPVYTLEPAEFPAAMLPALGIAAVKNAAFNRETNILQLEIESDRELASLAPDFPALLKTHDSIDGVLVTAPGTDGFDYHYRYFWPWAGTNEDPVTGGVQTFLAGYWAERLGKTKMRAFQSSSRTGTMQVELRDGKVYLTGDAVIVLEGMLTV